MSYVQAQLIIFICMLTHGQCLTSKFNSLENDKVIIIDQDGTSDLECCMYGNCYCSNLSLALEHIQDNTEIRIQSAVSLHNVVVFENVSNIKITSDSNATGTVRCDNQGGLVGKNINYIAIQGITWDSCSGISFKDVVHTVNFLNFVNFTLMLYGLGSVTINGSTFTHNDSSIDILTSPIIMYDSKLYSDSKSGSLVINTTNVSGTLLCSINVTISRAIYIVEDLALNVILAEAHFEFLGNSATFDGGANHQMSRYYYYLLKNTDIRINSAYVKTEFLNMDFHNVSSSPCYSYIYPAYKNSTVNVNIANISGGSLNFWLHDLHLSAIVYDCYGKRTGPVNASFQCCDDTNAFPYNCTIDSQVSSVTVTSKNTIVTCPDLNAITCKFSVISVTGSVESSDIYVIVQRFGHICDDIAHAYSDGICLPICLPYLPLHDYYCSQQSIVPGYWYDNGFRRFVASCPIGQYNYSFQRNLLYTPAAIFPDRNSQCNKHWGGLACGECNFSAGFIIKYDTTECVPKHECLTTSVTYSILILLAVSFSYWIIIISFIFVLLHFKFDITAGYAYGLLFYYSVLEQLVNDITSHLSRNLETSVGHHFHDHVVRDYEFMRLKVLPFLSSIGNLKPPFTGFMNLCFGNAETIDHLMLSYIHPLIVTFLVVVIFILARNFVLVARTIGRFVNSKSICILLLLSYSSVTYTSMQLLKSLPVFNSDGENTAIQAYWSPTVKYFHGRHLWYGIIAILCELIIGIGIPLVLIFQRYLIHCSNINFATRLKKHVIDQLKGCYKEEYYWFAAYYLICRQVLYGVNNLVDYFSRYWASNNSIIDTPYPKFTIMLTICILIMVMHTSFQPYKKKDLNILDGFILLSLIGLLLSALEVYKDKIIGVIFWFLPLLILINYLAYFTKLKYLIIPCSCAAIIIAVIFFGTYSNIFAILLLASSVIVSIAYIIYVLKCLFRRFCNTRPRYLAINEQNEVNENSNAEVSCYSY